MKRSCGAVLRFALATTIIACRSGGDIDCIAAPVQNALALTVVDSVTGGRPTATATVIATNGTRTETHASPSAPDENLYIIGFGWTGVINVMVRAPGYADWSMSGIQTITNACGTSGTVRLTARLQR
jgi:hypothetical protein